MSLRLVFMGTPDFALPALKALIAAGHDIAAVYSQPPRPAGRGLEAKPSPVARLAREQSIELRMPASLKSAEEQKAFAALASDAAVVVAYGLLLPPAVLQAPRHGCFNIHASLLPRWRGAAPIQRAIMAGDSETGVSIMRMEEGLDTGPICLSVRTPITPEMTADRLHDELAVLGAQAISEALARIEIDRLACIPQPAEGVLYAHKIDKTEAHIDFTRSAIELRNHIHGLSPSPGAWFAAPGENRPIRIKVLVCETVDRNGTPGKVLDRRLTIACGAGALRPLKVQREGKGSMSGEELLRGFPIAPGTMLA